MTPDRRALIRRLIDAAAVPLLDPPTADDPVLRYADPATITAAFGESVGLALADEEPAHTDDDLVAAAEAVRRWSVHTSHPRFVNQNFAGPDPIGVVGDWMGAALNTTNATYEVAPVFTLMERALLDKLARLAGFPRDTDEPPGLFVAGGSMAMLLGLQLARFRRDPDVVRRGATGERVAVFVSEAGHYSVKKAAALLGLGLDSVVTVAVAEDGAMKPSALAEAIADTRATGRTPLAVVATAGTTVTAAFDPIDALAEICEREDLWLHVDGAYGGSALLSPAQQHRLAGLDRADSMIWDLHKMMGMTQQCSVLLVREPELLAPCFAVGADYLFQPDKRNAELDSGDRTFHCGRRVDVLKAWFAWKSHGDAGLAARIDHAVALTDHVRDRVRASDEFAFTAAGDFTNVCFLWVPPELRPLDLAHLSADARARLHRLAPVVKARIQDAGTALMGYQPVDGLNCFRLLFMNPVVSVDDADDLLRIIAEAATTEWAS